MKRFTELFSGSSVMLFHAALTGWMFCLSKINTEFEAMSLNYLPLCVLLLLAYYLDRLMLHRSAPVPIFAVAQIVFIALAAWVFTKCVYLQPFKTGTVVINCIIYCVGFLIACFVAWMPTTENGVLMRFDGLAVMIIILLVLDELLVMPAAGGAVAMCAVCLVLLLLSSISMRSGRLSGRGSAVQGGGNHILGRTRVKESEAKAEQELKVRGAGKTGKSAQGAQQNGEPKGRADKVQKRRARLAI